MMMMIMMLMMIMRIMIREEADMATVQKRVYNALATNLEAQRARSSSLPSLLAPQSGALRISAYGDFQSHPSTYSFRAFKPFYGDQKQCK